MTKPCVQRVKNELHRPRVIFFSCDYRYVCVSISLLRIVLLKIFKGKKYNLGREGELVVFGCFYGQHQAWEFLELLSERMCLS